MVVVFHQDFFCNIPRKQPAKTTYSSSGQWVRFLKFLEVQSQYGILYSLSSLSGCIGLTWSSRGALGLRTALSVKVLCLLKFTLRLLDPRSEIPASHLNPKGSIFPNRVPLGVPVRIPRKGSFNKRVFRVLSLRVHVPK